MKRKLIRLRCRRSCFQLTNRKQYTDKLFFANFYSETHKFTVKSNSRNTDWIVDPFPQVKSAEHMATINTKIICLRSGAFPNFSWKLYQKYIKRLWNIYKYINFLSITYFPWAQCVNCKITWKFFKKVAWSQFRKGQALRRQGNKVEVLEGKFRTFTYIITRLIETAIHVFVYCSEWIKKYILTEKASVRSDFVGAL